MSTVHAREWISTEVNRRLLHHFVDNYGTNAEVTNIVNTRELWFVLVANPDGYQHTFDVERLWRKNLRDNNGDGQTTNADGVDSEPELRRTLEL
jgi:murein tripeptide amidase MpaA